MAEGFAKLELKLRFEEEVNAWMLRIEARVRAWVAETAALVEEYAKNLAPVNLGQLRASIRHDLDTIAGALVKAEIGTNCGYGLCIEKGTEPHWPPPGPLEAWAARVLGDADLGFVVARAIAERGTDPQPFLYPAYERALSQQMPKFRAMFA